MPTFILLVPVALAGIVIVTSITVLITFLIFKREKKIELKASAEGEKIDKMLEDDKISEKEANELKRAVGAYSISEDESMSEDSHILITGILHITNSILGVFGMALFFLFFSVAFYRMAPQTECAGKPLPGAFQAMPGGIMILIGLIISVFIFLELIAGIFLIKRKSWARFVIVGFSILVIFSFPLGTALGVYSLWSLLIRENAGRYFETKN